MGIMRGRGKKKRASRGVAPGSAPGTMVAVVDSARPEMRVMAYGPEGLEERVVESAAAALVMREKWPVVWLDVRGLGDVEVLQKIVSDVGMHDLAAEDVVNQNHRAKVEEFDEAYHLVVRGPAGTAPFESRQLNLFVSPGLVVSFQERVGGWLEPVRERIRQGGKRLRRHGIDYLVYALVDAVTDHYFPIIEAYSEHLEELEHMALEAPSRETINTITQVQRDLLEVKRAVFPLREVIGKMSTDYSGPEGEHEVFWRDCADHVIVILDSLETQRETCRSLIDLTLSSMSHQMNDVMRVLTIIATIFIPLGFIAGVYGMNFDRAVSGYNMPELGFAYGYPVALGFMAIVGLGLVFFFYRKGWIGSGRRRASGTVDGNNIGS